MSVLKTQDQRTIVLSQEDYIPILIDSFLIDRRSQSLSNETISFYKKKLKYFLKYCEDQAVTQVSQLTADFLRRYILQLSEGIIQAESMLVSDLYAHFCYGLNWRRSCPLIGETPSVKFKRQE